jgi:hypothetical protein
LKNFKIIQPTLSQVSWNKVYEGWKEMTNALIRGYTNCGFEAWTVPCLYVAGKYMRIFAIKADESAANSNGLPAHFGDDISPEAEKNENLEDAARQLNRIFTICLSDRLVSSFRSESGLANSWQSTS